MRPLQPGQFRCQHLPWKDGIVVRRVHQKDRYVDVSDSYIKKETARQLEEIERRRKSYCEGRPAPEIVGRIAIVVDDGIATGATMRVALQAVRRRRPARLVLAVPVAPPATLAALGEQADEAICLETPDMLGAIGFYYRDFHQMSDAEVTDLLARALGSADTSPGTPAL